MTSWIQTHILQELIRHKTRRYSELRPRDVEGNLFMYHLKGLIKEGLIEKADSVYTLSVKGLQHVGLMSLETGKPRVQPKILNAIVSQNNAGEYLFVKWRRQPNIDQVSFPHGMMHFGKSVFDMASRELVEKTGLIAELAHRGDIYVRGKRGDEVDRHMLVHVFETTTIYGEDKKQMRPEVSEPFWAPLNAIKQREYVPGFYEVAQLMAVRSGYFFEEVELDIM